MTQLAQDVKLLVFLSRPLVAEAQTQLSLGTSSLMKSRINFESISRRFYLNVPGIFCLTSLFISLLSHH